MLNPLVSVLQQPRSLGFNAGTISLHAWRCSPCRPPVVYRMLRKINIYAAANSGRMISSPLESCAVWGVVLENKNVTSEWWIRNDLWKMAWESDFWQVDKFELVEVMGTRNPSKVDVKSHGIIQKQAPLWALGCWGWLLSCCHPMCHLAGPMV